MIDKNKKIRKYWPGDLGMHAHDNMKNALDNTLTAVNHGFNWADGTILGMGRGAGNAKIEDLIKRIKKSKTTNIDRLIINHFVGLKKNTNGDLTNFTTLLENIKSIQHTFKQYLTIKDIRNLITKKLFIT